MFHKLSIPSRFLFHVELPCQYRKGLEDLHELPANFELPDFENLEQSGNPASAFTQKNNSKRFSVRTAWNEDGIAFQFFVSGKSKELWCNPHRPDESDRIELWLDTRNVHNVHRGTRYCHRFVCLPQGEGPEGEKPYVVMFPINRSKQMPNEVPNDSIKMKSRVLRNCYSFFVYFSSGALTGFDPNEFRDLGIAWALIDREIPMKTLTAGAPFPFMEDPSLWYSLHLEDPAPSEQNHS